MKKSKNPTKQMMFPSFSSTLLPPTIHQKSKFVCSDFSIHLKEGNFDPGKSDSDCRIERPWYKSMPLERPLQFLNVYICKYMYIYIYTFQSICTCLFMSIEKEMYTYRALHIYTSIDFDRYINIDIHMYTHVCIYIHIYIYIYVLIFI